MENVKIFNQSHCIRQVSWEILKVFRAGNVVFSQSYQFGWVRPLISLGRCSLLTFLPWKNGGWILKEWIHIALYYYYYYYFYYHFSIQSSLFSKSVNIQTTSCSSISSASMYVLSLLYFMFLLCMVLSCMMFTFIFILKHTESVLVVQNVLYK